MRPGVAFVIGGSVALSATACEPVATCPRTVTEAAAIEYDNEVVAGGYVIRYIPSDDDPQYRGYDVNVTRPASERAQLNTYLLRVDAPLPGIANGQPVLLMGERTDRSFVLVPGACPALTPTTDADVTGR